MFKEVNTNLLKDLFELLEREIRTFPTITAYRNSIEKLCRDF